MHRIRTLAPLLWLMAVVLCALSVLAVPVRAEDDAPAADPLVPSTWLGLPSVDPRGRTPFNPSVLFERYLSRPDATPPVEGESVRGTSGRTAAWRVVTPDAEGNVAAGDLGAAYATVEVPSTQVWMAEIHRASVLYVGGAPHAGNVYGHGGIVRTPVLLRQGKNHVFAFGFRGSFRVTFVQPDKPIFVAQGDAVLPEVVPGEGISRDAAVVVVNATRAPVEHLLVSTDLRFDGAGEEEEDDDGRFTVRTSLSLPPLGMQKVALPQLPRSCPTDVTQGSLTVRLQRGLDVLDECSWPLEVREQGSAWRRTFRSDVDGSVQFYAVLKPPGPAPEGTDIVLSLHGAGVDAWNQANAYGLKSDFWIVAATNRRPFGFDWQDWGRRDAYEVLDDVLRFSGIPRARVHLTGHSMGGHGTWHLAVNDPDGFASIAPSAGWISFDTYGGRPDGALKRLWHAADRASLTEDLLGNLRDVPLYVLHGTDDDNVPADQARRLQKKLAGVAREQTFHYEPGKGHWWHGDVEGGAACVDWPGFFAMFRKHEIPGVPHDLDWAIADLSLDADHHWLRVVQPLQYGEASHVKATYDPTLARVEVETKNVRRLVIEHPQLGLPLHRGEVVIDGKRLEPSDLVFERGPGGWRTVAAPLDPGEKRPERMGPFKRAFDRRFVLVVGTTGAADETKALFEKVTYDAEQWLYRANGRAVVLTDRQYLAKAETYRGRNVILYGNADTNAAWGAVIPTSCPIHPERGRVKVGAKTYEGDAYGILLVYPKKGEADALAAAVADTGVPGTRLNFRIPCFVSGVGIPDFVVYGPEVLTRGDEGVRAAGFFDRLWRLAD